MIGPVELICSFLLDLAIGDPQWLPHPVRIIGKAIAGVEAFLRRRSNMINERVAGIILVFVIVTATAGIALLVSNFLSSLMNGPYRIVGLIILIYLISTTLALRELIRSGRQVIHAIKSNDLANARKSLSMIVGRDTERLDQNGVLRAVIETLSENLSDGFIAPLFYLVIAGLPGAFAYKAVNTLDSMVGYKNEKYLRFGWAAARLDDMVNYVPARISGFCITAAVFVYFLLQDPGAAAGAARKSYLIMLRDGRNHSSPNSGILEAAIAGGLGIRLGGPSTYGGILVDKPYIGEQQNENFPVAADRALAIVMLAGLIGVLMASGFFELARFI